MECTVCNDQGLVMADHQVNEIDHCQKYGGIWLDRAKLWIFYMVPRIVTSRS